MARDPPQGARAPSRGRAGRHLKIGVRARLLVGLHPELVHARERVRKLFLEPVPVRAAVLLKSRAVACKGLAVRQLEALESQFQAREHRLDLRQGEAMLLHME